MSSRRRVVAVLAVSVALVAIITACDPTGTPEECAGQVTTTTVVDCAWTTSTTTDPSTSTSTTDSSVTTTEATTTSTTLATTTTESTTTTTEPTTTTTTAPWWPYKGNQAGPRVVVIGDSLISGSKNAINAALYPDYATQVIGMSGQKLAAAEAPLAPYPATNPDVVLIEFGTNDATGIRDDHTDTKRAAFKAKYLDIAAMFPTDTCFVPVTMPALREWPDWNESNRELNDWLLATFPNTIDWNAFENGQRAAGFQLLSNDMIHPEGLGRSAMAAMLLGGVERCLD